MSDHSLLRPPRTFDYGVELRIFRTQAARIAVALLILGLLALPFVTSRFWLSILNLTMISAIAAIGLNVVAGSAGQISLGHAFFIGVGAYGGAYLGDLGVPWLLWLPLSGVLAALSSLLVGPFTLRLRGLYMAFATIGLVFIGLHLFLNLDGITGGSAGRSIDAPQVFGASLSAPSEVLGVTLSGEQKWFFVLFALTAVVALAVRNLQRTRWGRAFNAVRDHDVAARVSGIDLAKAKLYAFVTSAFLAGMSGALLGSFTGFINPERFNLFLSVDYLFMIIIGGMGSVLGAILGAAFITLLPRAIEEFSGSLPFVEQSLTATRGFTPEVLSLMLYGLVTMAFLMFEPEGLAGAWRRVRAYFVAWPFRY